MDGVTLYMLVLAGTILPIAAFVAFMAHRERLRDDAEDAERAGRTAAE
jgi:hypothetical protein